MRLQWVTPKPTDSFVPKLKKDAAEFTLDLAMQVWQGAVDRTPVASGELRASWNLSQGSPNFLTVGKADSSPGSTGAPLPPPQRPNIEVAPLEASRFFVANGKKYAGFAEFGSPTIAPHLMLTRAVQAANR